LKYLNELTTSILLDLLIDVCEHDLYMHVIGVIEEVLDEVEYTKGP
jgi:hypothetical protein